MRNARMGSRGVTCYLSGLLGLGNELVYTDDVFALVPPNIPFTARKRSKAMPSFKGIYKGAVESGGEEREAAISV
jgi:hypothetical protein